MCEEEGFEEKNELFQMRFFSEKEIADFLKNLIKTQGLTHADIGYLFNLDDSTVSDLLRGKYHLNVDRLILLLRYFGYELLISQLDVDENTALNEDYDLDQDMIDFEMYLLESKEQKKILREGKRKSRK
ncbi:MAG: helix-turn-helix transcriptional regulator [Candidatus Eremiobacterota bacterium]